MIHLALWEHLVETCLQRVLGCVLSSSWAQSASGAGLRTPCWPIDTCGVLIGLSCLLPTPDLHPSHSVLVLSTPLCPTLGTPASGLPGSSGPLCSSHFRSIEKACTFSHWSSVKCWPVESTVKKSEATAPSTSVMGPGCGRKDRAEDEPGGLRNYSVQKSCEAVSSSMAQGPAHLPSPRLHSRMHPHS